MSAGELAARLEARGYGEEEIEKTVRQLVSKRYIDEESYAVDIVEHLKRKGYGPHRIWAELRRRFVDESAAESAMEKCGDCSNELKAFMDKYAEKHDLTDEKTRQHTLAMLYRRGFDMSEIYEELETRG